MSRELFVNLPVSDLDRSMGFFRGLGFAFDPRFSDERGACMVVGEGRYVMLLVRDFFRGFTARPVAEPDAPTEVIVALSADSRADVDDLADRALAAGARQTLDPMDDGPMYQRSFTDLDGHHWEVLWMDPAALSG